MTRIRAPGDAKTTASQVGAFSPEATVRSVPSGPIVLIGPDRSLSSWRLSGESKATSLGPGEPATTDPSAGKSGAFRTEAVARSRLPWGRGHVEGSEDRRGLERHFRRIEAQAGGNRRAAGRSQGLAQRGRVGRTGSRVAPVKLTGDEPGRCRRRPDRVLGLTRAPRAGPGYHLIGPRRAAGEQGQAEHPRRAARSRLVRPLDRSR